MLIAAGSKTPPDFGAAPEGTGMHEPRQRRLASGIIVTRTPIIGTRLVLYDAWEPSSYTGPHGTVTTLDGQTYGKVKTRRFSERQLVAGTSAYIQVHQHYDALAATAVAAIREAFPEVKGNERDGTIEEVVDA